jgi:hypothetical protein
MNCPYCKDEMREDKRGYWTCGRCLGEFWPGEQQEERGEYQKRQVIYAKDSYFYFGLAESTYGINHKPVNPPGAIHFGGGSKSGKKRKKKPNKGMQIVYET